MARAYWSHQGEKPRARAAQIWSELENVNALGANEQRQAVAEAIRLAEQNEDRKSVV